VIRAVFFDWGNTLAAWEFDQELFVEGHAHGLVALGPQAPAQEAFTQAFGECVLPLLLGPGEDEIDYVAEVGSLLASLGVDADDDAVWRFVEAEHRVWRPAHLLEPDVLELLDALRDRGLKVGLISNVFDPPSLMRGLFAELGLLERLDAVALSAEVGKRKPHPAIFQSALEQAGVLPAEAVMVGDRLREDVGGAQGVGLAAIQAAWFERDGSGAAVPSAIAETPADVRRWLCTT
jgi:HAD superfamily hydrolase (TIGR01509 family)